MAEPNEIADGEKPVVPETTSELQQELPNVESPPLSPDEKLSEPVLDAQMKPQEKAEEKPEDVQPEPAPALEAPEPVAPPSAPRFALPHISRRMRRRAALAATVLLAAGFGAAVGAIANRAPAPQPDDALVAENHALQRSVAKLNKDVAALKTHIETTARETKTQIAKATGKLNDRIDKAVEVTGSIGKPATAPAAIAKTEPAPLPTPRPAIVEGWAVREAMNGRVYVEHRGEFFRVVPGVPLPGLGKVESIKREGDKLVVATTKGLITENRSTVAIRPRPRYAPPYWPPY
jgi:hypothetical protein